MSDGWGNVTYFTTLKQSDDMKALFISYIQLYYMKGVLLSGFEGLFIWENLSVTGACAGCIRKASTF